MSHYTQRERKARIDQVRIWLGRGHSVERVIIASMDMFSCTRRKALEYMAEVTRD